MADISSSDWLYRATRHAPKGISAALAVLISVEIIRIAATLAGPDSAKPLRPPVVPSRARTVSTGVDVARIVSAHLFGTAALDPATQDPANAPRSAANLALTGTIATLNPRQGMAIIGDQGQFKVYSVGEHVGEASLHSVYLDRVILERNGSLESLVLPRPVSGAESSRVRGSGALRAAAAAVGASPPAELSETAIVDKVANSNIESDGGGQMLGIRVVPGQDISAFAHSGLIGGDVVIAVNGTKLDVPDRSQDIWKQVSTGTAVTVLRRGKLQDITLNLAP
jgi:general secretion pathway protein C